MNRVARIERFEFLLSEREKFDIYKIFLAERSEDMLLVRTQPKRVMASESLGYSTQPGYLFS